MAYKSLRDFMAMLEAEGELVRVSEPVSTHLEMTEIQTRLLRNGGPAVIFEKPVMPDGSISPIPCLANLFGTVKRVAMGVTLEKKSRTTAAELREVGELLAFLRNPTPPRGLGDAMEMLPLAQTVMSMRPKTVKTAPVQQVVLKGDDIDPLYKFLTDKTTNPDFGGDIGWNFSKFLLDKNGKVVARFAPGDKPEGDKIVQAIESALK